MLSRFLVFLFWVASVGGAAAQTSFPYVVELQPVTVPGLPGLHSFAFAQHGGKWLIIGGRKDGIHARQPFNAFPESQNNTDIYVVDLAAQQTWSASVNALPVNLKEQLQATNMQFHQVDDTLYIVGGYAYAASLSDHITFPYLTTVAVSSLINDVIGGANITGNFKQLEDTAFAVTGGHLGRIDEAFYLVGGQRFDGAYNPMGGPTFTQSYTNQVRKFNIDNSAASLVVSNYSTITDPVHLHRRDYNLLPQIFPDGSHGYTVSSGVFQVNEDLPFLYPVDITASGHTPVTSFNQYLSNYHSACAFAFDSTLNEMHSLFFGGISRYYYQGSSLVQDDGVPFVKTISRVTRFADGSLEEYRLPLEMPALHGASAEMIPNLDLPHYDEEIVNLNATSEDTLLIGHIVGGINSPSLNPFNVNQSNTTSASNTVYAVYFIRNQPNTVQAINGKNPYDISVSPNPVDHVMQVSFELAKPVNIDYYITTSNGKMVEQGRVTETAVGENYVEFSTDSLAGQMLFVTFVFENKFFVTKKVATY